MWVIVNPASSGSKWANGKANFIGDSITDGSGGSNYRQYVVSNLGLSLGRNYGVSGTTVSNINQPFYNRVAGMDADADVNFVLGGTNDFSLNCELGALYTLDGSNTRIATTDLATFYGAYHQLAKNLIAKFPTKRNVLITPLHRGNYASQPSDFKPNTKGYYLRDFVNAVIEIGKWYGLPVCDMYTLSNMTPNESAQNTLYFSDQLHPTDLGYRRLADVLSAFLNTL